MKKKLLFFLFLNTSCAATLVSSPEKNLHVIGYNTGRYGMQWYNDKFNEKAHHVCQDQDFEIIEKSAHPKALKGAGILVDQFNYYWVIRCKPKTR